jgi:CheY-like chemotaxis protein
MNGVKVIKELQRYIEEVHQLYPLDKPIFIIATAYYSATFEEFALKNGVDHCVEKPVTIELI